VGNINYLIGYLIAAIIIIGAVAIIVFMVYRRVTGKASSSECASCKMAEKVAPPGGASRNCHPTTTEFSVSIGTHRNPTRDDTRQGDGYERKPSE
jgi:hypothetical protein